MAEEANGIFEPSRKSACMPYDTVCSLYHLGDREIDLSHWFPLKRMTNITSSKDEEEKKKVKREILCLKAAAVFSV